jgi:hypothetical protein
VQSFQDAVKVEDGMRYNEPPDWKLPTRHYLGAHCWKQADLPMPKSLPDDLKVNRENGWSLTGLQRCPECAGRKSDVAAHAKRFAKAWKNSDIGVSSSRF